MYKRKYWIVLSFLFILSIFMACGNEIHHITPESIDSVAVTEPEKAKDEELQDIPEETNIYSYLTGLPISEEKRNNRPVAVMLSNIESGCPQYGIEKASVIYEAPIETRITRLMGIFEDWENIEKIGYIRSSRDYFVYSAMEHDAIYCHFGQATLYVGELLNSGKVDTISAAVAGINHPAKYAFHRTVDRKAPHNVITSGPDILMDVDRFGYSLTYHETFKPKFTFIYDKDKDIYKDKTEVKEIYPGGKAVNSRNGYGKIQAYFEYKDGKYYRYQYGCPQIDEETGNQLSYENVILQYCYGEVRDENDYLAFSSHGDNGYPVQVFTKGRMIEGTWSRFSDTDPAVYVDEKGENIKLTPGKTWICIIWMEYADDVILD